VHSDSAAAIACRNEIAIGSPAGRAAISAVIIVPRLPRCWTTTSSFDAK
jgi:hypothetical protein